MSSTAYNQMWRTAQLTLRDLVHADDRLSARKREEDKRLALTWVLRLYADYIRIVRTLDECYDQLVQPQKRILVRKLLDGCIGRLLELKRELVVELDKSNFHYFDDVLIEQRLTYEDLEIPSPQYYYRERESELKKRRELIQEILDKPPPSLGSGSLEETDQPAELQGPKAVPRRPRRSDSTVMLAQQQQRKEEVEMPEQRSLREATSLLQAAERARQCRIESYNRRRMLMLKYRGEKKDDKPDLEHQAWAATFIQKHYRGHRERRKIKQYLEREDTLVGMIMPKFIDYSYRGRIVEVQEMRRALRREAQAAYETAVMQQREFVDRILSPEVFEGIAEELREWIKVWYYDVRKLPKFPGENEVKLKDTLLGLPKGTPPDMFSLVDPELPGITTRKLGGSSLISAGFWCEPHDFKVATEALAKKKKGEKRPKLSKEEKKELREKARQAKKADKERLKLEKLRGFKLDESGAVPALKVAEREYKQEWEFKRPDTENPSEKHYVDLIRLDEMHEKHVAMRVAVDELMRAELEMLLDAEWREKMKGKKKQKPRKKGKSRKGKGKGKGKKGKKDPTGHMTTEELLEELVRAGIIKNSGVSHMQDFYGEPSYSNSELRRQFKDPLPALGDIRQVVREYCILPLGSQRVHELAPLTNSVLLAGPPECGKSLLVDIICTETGAVRFDLSPEALEGQYPGKAGMTMLLHLVNKVARLLQPAVIVIDNAHRNFYKKVPKEEKPMEPKRIAKKLKKIAKGIKAQDQILIVGTTNQPWLAKGSQLIKAYQRHIFIPPMDYGSRSLMWHKLIMAYKGVDRNFEVTPLAHVTEWVSLHRMREVVSRALNVERRIQLSYRPLQHHELLALLLEYPVDPPLKDRPKWLKWYNKTPQQKLRSKLVAQWMQEAEKAKKK